MHVPPEDRGGKHHPSDPQPLAWEFFASSYYISHNSLLNCFKYNRMRRLDFSHFRIYFKWTFVGFP